VESEDGQDKKSFTRAAHSLRGAQDFWGSLGEEVLGEEMDCEPGEVDYRILQRLLGMEEGYEIILTRAMKVVEPLIVAQIPQQDVEDVLMEFSLLLIRKVRTYEGRGRFVSWLRRLARCVIAKYYREKPKELFVDPVEAKEKWESERDIKEEDWSEIEFLFEGVMRKIEELPKEKREIIELYYLREMTTGEIAKALGKPEGTIRRRLSEAMSKLRGKLRESERNSSCARLYIMEVHKTEKKSEKKERKKVTRRQFLKDLGLFTVAGIALNKLDFLAGEIIKRTGGDVRVLQWHCDGGQYYQPPCDPDHPYDCTWPFPFHCENLVICAQDIQCVQGNDIYGCTERVFNCSNIFDCDVFNCTLATFGCNVDNFHCHTKYNPTYG